LPGRCTQPDTETTLVPVDCSVPNRRYQSAPRLTMCGTAQSVSTLLISVGPPYRPWIAGNGGFSRGFPRFPSSESSSAVSSPQM
jgi:hypothetical protein